MGNRGVIRLKDAYASWVAAVVIDSGLTRQEATDILQVHAPTLTNEEGGDWWVALSAEYGTLGILQNGTYTGLRNQVGQDGEAAVNDLFNALRHRVNELPETEPLRRGIRRDNDQRDFDNLDDDIAEIVANKTGTNIQLDAAYDAAISALEGRRSMLADRLL